jgi:hypothetical protein
MVEVRLRPFDGRIITFENANVGRNTSSSSSTSSTSAAFNAQDTNKEVVNSNFDHEFDVEHVKCDFLNDERNRDKIDLNENHVKKRKSRHECEDVIITSCTENDRKKRGNAMKYVPKIMPPIQLMIARPVPSMQGHTAFLTFAVAPNQLNSE